MAALLIASQGALAQRPTDAGEQLQQIPPAPTPPRTAPVFEVEPRPVEADTGAAGPKVRIDALRVTGQTLFPEATLIAAGGFVPGAELGLAEMRAIAARITAFYNARGYFLAQAYLPPQDVSAGSVTIAVIEGRYGEISLQNRTNLADGVARRVLGGLDRGDIVASAPLERRLLLLSDIPGVAVRSTLTPGGGVGTSDLMVALDPARRITGSVEADNAGNRYTGAYRGGGSLDLNNPTGIGDLVSLRVLGSTSGLGYGRIAYQAPIGNLTLGAAYSHVRYDLGREFSSLDADGTADILSLFGSYPVIRSRDSNLYALASVEAGWFEDRIGLLSLESDKRTTAINVGVTGDSHDDFAGGGWNIYSASWTFGDLDIRTPLDRAADAVTARSNGGFSKFEFAFARLQALGGPLSLYGAIRGQVAFDNLDSSQKMELGGAYAVRAYPEGEAYADQGYVATIEARLALDRWTAGLPGQLEAIAFVDGGIVEFAHDPWFAGSNRAYRSGIGAGLAWYGPQNLIIRATYAHRLGDPATSAPADDGQFWFQFVKLF
ncbi:MAG: ShlB/FhaC/HecB family hemolysin secretion/activation protein [Allosphingosinicella sp.]